MNNYEQNQPAEVSHYPQAKVDEGSTAVKDFVAPTPVAPASAVVGLPVKDGYEANDQNPHGSRSRGHGFWRGCCAGMCCCCLLDICF